MDPEGTLWVTERCGVTSRVDTSSGKITIVSTITETVEIRKSGLLGMALHPNFSTEPFVYAIYSYESNGIQNRLIRSHWDGPMLGPPETLLDSIPRANNHNGSRLAFGPDDGLL